MNMMEKNHKKINLFGILGIFVSFVITVTFNTLNGMGGNLSSIKQYYYLFCQSCHFFWPQKVDRMKTKHFYFVDVF
jgi:hypothetical protein